MNFLSLFAGIGGFDRGLAKAGMACVGQVEINEFCLRVLEYHWPDVKRVRDIHGVFQETFGAGIDLICGGPPCQPASCAGKRRGVEDDRWLWPETIRVVGLYRPRWCLFENPTGILSLQGGVPFESVLSSLEGQGYTVQTFIIPACAVDAPHRRDRVWIVAHRSSERRQQISESAHGNEGSNERWSSQNVHKSTSYGQRGGDGALANSGGKRLSERELFSGVQCEEMETQSGKTVVGNGSHVSHPESVRRGQRNQDTGRRREGAGEKEERTGSSNGCRWEPEFAVGQLVDGLSGGLVRFAGRVAVGIPERAEKIKALGNAVVPQLVEIIGKMIMEVDELERMLQ